MYTTRAKKGGAFYLYAVLFLLVGWAWMLWSVFNHSHHGITVCVIKNITGIPCPACGSTSSLMQIMEGNWWTALYINPLGYLMAIGLIAAPLWLITDLATGRSSMFHSVNRFDNAFRRRPLLLLVVLLPLLLNWIWNIMKM